MTKAEMIERYGIEWYEAYKARDKARYANDSEFREACRARSNAYSKARDKARYVKDGRIDLIENYDKAKVNNFKGWHIHHKDEIRILPSGMIAIRTKEELIENGRYYNCPPNELVWMKQSEHVALHNKFRTRQNA